MKLRLAPWIWGHIQPSRTSYRYSGTREVSWFFISTARALYQNNYLVHVKYPHILFCAWVRADSCPLKVYDGPLPEPQSHSSVYQMPGVPPKSPHARSWVMESPYLSRRAQEGTCVAVQTPPDQDSDHT